MSKSRRKNSSLMANVKTEYFLWFCYWKPVNLFCNAFEWQNRLANRSSLTSKFTLKCPIQFSFEEDSWGKFLSSYNRRLSLSFLLYMTPSNQIENLPIRYATRSDIFSNTLFEIDIRKLFISLLSLFYIHFLVAWIFQSEVQVSIKNWWAKWTKGEWIV